MKNLLKLVLIMIPLFTKAQTNTDSLYRAYDSKKDFIFGTSTFVERYRADNMFTRDSVDVFGIEESLRLNRSGINALFIFFEVKYENWHYEDFQNSGPSNFDTEKSITFGGGFGSNFHFFSVGKKFHFTSGLETKIDVMKCIDYSTFSITVEPYIGFSYKNQYLIEIGDKIDSSLPTLNSPSIKLSYFFF